MLERATQRSLSIFEFDPLLSCLPAVEWLLRTPERRALAAKLTCNQMQGFGLVHACAHWNCAAALKLLIDSGFDYDEPDQGGKKKEKKKIKKKKKSLKTKIKSAVVDKRVFNVWSCVLHRLYAAVPRRQPGVCRLCPAATGAT